MKKLWFVPPIAGIAALILFWDYLWRKIAIDTGSGNPPGCTGPSACHNYNFNSGFGSILIPYILQVTSAIILLWWHNQCHVSGCFWPRLAHKTSAGDFACWRHHPESKLSVERLHARHHRANDANAKLDEIHRHVSGEAGDFPPPP